MALNSMPLLRAKTSPFVVGIMTALVGLCFSARLHAQVEEAEQVAESELPLTDARSGAIRFGNANVIMSYSSTRYGQENGQFGIGLQNRTMLDNGAFLFDAKYNMDFSDISTMGVNIGGGFRWMHPGLLSGAPRIFGVTGWYDGANSSLDNYFNQIGLSLESLGERWDFRLNGNAPVGKTRQTGAGVSTGQIGYYSFYLSELTFVPIDQAVSVVDFEAACRVRDYNTWLFAGGYTVHAQGETEAGFKAGARGYVGEDLQLQLAVTHDEFFGTDVTFGLMWFPGRTPSHGRSAWSLENRLREPVLRPDYVALRRESTYGGVALTDGDGDRIRVVHVDSDATGTGDGSYESPFTSLDDVYAGSQASDIILVHSGSTHTGQTIALRDYQRLLGEGNNVTHTVYTSKFGYIDLPETSDGALAGAIPVITNTTGDVITLAAADTTHDSDVDVSSNEVSNLSIQGGTRGIVSASVGIADANINNMTIANTTGNGIELTPFVETIEDTSTTQVRFSPTIDQVTFSGVGGDDIHLDATTGQPSSVSVTESINITDVASTDSGGYGVNLIGNQSSATITRYTFDGGTTATGALHFSGSKAGAAVTDATITGSGIGIDIVDSSEGTFTFSSTAITDTTGACFNLNGGTATVTFTGTITQGASAAAVAIGGGHTGTVNFNELETDEGVITATAGTGLQFNEANGTYKFNDAVVLNGGDAGIDILGDSTGTFTFSDTTITSPTGTAFNLEGGSATVTFTGQITQANSAAAVSISGGHTGTVNFNEVDTDEGVISATAGTGLQFDNADGTYKFNDAVVLNGGDAGIDILGDSTGTFTFSDTTITSPTGIAFNLEGGSATVTFTGQITQANDAAAVSISGGHTGTVNFNEVDTDEGVISATNGTGLQFNEANGTYKFNDAVVLNGGDAGIDILGDSTGTFTFSDTTITSPTGIAFNLEGGSATVAFTGQITQANNYAAVSVSGGHTGTVTFAEATSGEGVISATSGTGLQFDNADGAYTFSNAVELAGGDAGIDILNGSAGTFTFGSDTEITNPTGIGLNINGSAASVTYSGTIDSDTGRAVAIQSNTGGTVTISGDITATGEGILVDSNTGGTFRFSGTVSLNTGANTAVTISSNDSDVTTSFSDLQIVTSGATGFSASGGGILQITGTTSTIDTTSATALSVSGMEISSSGVAFKSVSADGGTNGIVLSGLTGSGTLSIGSSGSSVGDGGTIQNTTGDGISITNAAHVSLNNMLVTTVGGDGINLAHTSGSFDVTIADSNINGATGQGIDLSANATGTMTLAISGNQISGNGAESISLTMGTSAGTANITVDGNTVANSSSQEAMLLTINGGTVNLLAEENAFSNDSTSAAFYAQANNSSTLNATINDNSFSNADGRGLEIENNNVASVRLSLLDNQASSGSSPSTPFLLDKNGGSFGVVLLNPQPDAESYTEPNVNQRNGGTGAYADYPTNWVIEMDPTIGSFTHLNEGVVPTP